MDFFGFRKKFHQNKAEIKGSMARFCTKNLCKFKITLKLNYFSLVPTLLLQINTFTSETKNIITKN